MSEETRYCLMCGTQAVRRGDKFVHIIDREHDVVVRELERHEFIPMGQDNTCCARYGCTLGAAADVHDVPEKSQTDGWLDVIRDIGNEEKDTVPATSRIPKDIQAVVAKIRARIVELNDRRETGAKGLEEAIIALHSLAFEIESEIEAICTCHASPSQEHATYCPREGMDYNEESC